MPRRPAEDLLGARRGPPDGIPQPEGGAGDEQPAGGDADDHGVDRHPVGQGARADPRVEERAVDTRGARRAGGCRRDGRDNERPDRQRVHAEGPPQRAPSAADGKERHGVGDRQDEQLHAREARRRRQAEERDAARPAPARERDDERPERGEEERIGEGLARQQPGAHRVRDEHGGRGHEQREPGLDAEPAREAVGGDGRERDGESALGLRDPVRGAHVLYEPGGCRDERGEQRREGVELAADLRQPVRAERARQLRVDVLVREQDGSHLAPRERRSHDRREQHEGDERPMAAKQRHPVLYRRCSRKRKGPGRPGPLLLSDSSSAYGQSEPTAAVVAVSWPLNGPEAPVPRWT